jgi:FtsZ-binding cell division protein ZapB
MNQSIIDALKLEIKRLRELNRKLKDENQKLKEKINSP